ncbi:MAG TPA: metal ABC transporter permease [Vicinamibacterales bacterium]|nr:metal ABC transporter permease [Vicinamibacterales bacterium]
MSIEALVLSAVMAAAAGLVGCFAVMRRMALAADALSHVALPGIGVAIALHLHPLLGAATMLLFGALIVWGLEDRSRLATETIIGVIFSTALAIGSMMTSGDELFEALFGGAEQTPSRLEVAFGVLAGAAVIVFILRRKRALVVALVSPDIARTVGIDVRRLNLIYLEMFALTVALGLRYLGVLLMGSLIIIPAATAKRLSRGLDQMLLMAAGIAIAVTLAGSAAARVLHRPTGPVIVTIAAALFFATFLRRDADAA